MYSTDKWESIVIAVTRACNLNCNFCPVEKQASVLGYKKIKEILDYIGMLENRWPIRVKIQGGEPLLCWAGISNLIKNYDNPNIQFIITTNGRLLDKEKISFFKRNINKSKLVFSIDEQKWNLECPEALFKKVALLKDGDLLGNCAFNITLSHKYLKETLKILSFLKKAGVKDFRFFPAFYIPWDKEKLRSLRNTFKKIAELVGDVIPPQISYPKDRMKLKEFLLRSSEGNNIPLVSDHLLIDSNGDVFPSDAFLLKFFKPWKDLFRMANIYKPNWKKKILKFRNNTDYINFVNCLINAIYSFEVNYSIRRDNRSLFREYRVFVNKYAQLLNKSINYNNLEN